MHLHFVQSLEPLQGAGLGQAALSLHLAMRGKSGERYTADGIRSEALISELHAPSSLLPASRSMLLATRDAKFTREWPDVIQGVRKGPGKMFYAPELKRLAVEAVEEAEWFHGHGLYVWTNMWLGGEARKRGKPLVYHPQGFFDPWFLRRSRGKKRLAHWLFEDKNIAHVRWWRAVSNKEAGQIRAVVGDRAVVHVIPNGVDLGEVDAIATARVTSDLWRVTSEGAGGDALDAHEVKGERLKVEGNNGEQAQWSSLLSSQGFTGQGCASTGQGDRRQDTVTSDLLLLTRHGAWAERKRPKRLLFLSRIHAKKGLDLLVPAWGRLSKEFPDWELLIVGPDEGGYQVTVEKMMADCGCGETCWIHPAVSGAEKHALLRTADLFVLPSYSEGFPMAVLEAAAHRIPVVQTDECNFPELAASGGAWECRPERDSVEKALRTEVRRGGRDRSPWRPNALTAEDAERAERGLRGRGLVEKSYSWDQIADQVISACRA